MKTLNLKFAALALTMGFGANSALALTIDQTFYPGINQLSDNSAEYLINAGGGADTIVDVGDRLRGIFGMDTIESLSGLGSRSLLSGSGNNELSGLFDITVTGKTCVGGFGCSFTFGPTASFGATYGAGAMVAFFEDPTHEFSRLNDTIANLETNITNGSLLWVAGFGGGTSAFWNANAITDDIAIVGSVPSPGNGGGFNTGLDLLTNNGTRVFNQVSCFDAVAGALGLVDMCGSGSLLGTGGANTPYDSFDDVNFVMNAVPEPGTITLIGFGLLGLAGSFAARRRRKV